MTPSLTRRALMLSGAGLALAARLPAQAEDAIGVDDFLAVSARLTGTAAPGLEPEAARKILAALISTGRGPGLVLLRNDPRIAAGPVADEIVAAWYSGVCEADDGETLATFTGALVWNALDYSKPFGSCGGETGYWAEPPQS